MHPGHAYSCDKEIFVAARQAGAVVITKDSDFAVG